MAANDDQFISNDAVWNRQNALISLIEKDSAQHEALLRHARLKLKIFHRPENLDIEEARRVAGLVDMAMYLVAKNQMYAEKPCPEAMDDHVLKEITRVMDIVVGIETQAAAQGGL